MNTLALKLQNHSDTWALRSSTPVRFSQQWKPVLSAYYERLFIADSDQLDSVHARVTLLAKQAERAVRQRSRYYGTDLTTRLLESLSTLLDPNEFEGEVPQSDSLPAILRAVQIVGGVNVSLGVTEEGHFTALWSNEDRTIYVESLPNAHVRWAIAHENDDDMQIMSSDTSTLSEFSTAL